MQAHPAYRRRAGHDHLLLSNYWDAWGAYGERGTPEHAALANVTLGWHETAAAAWGMANHRHVGKCQISLPYVEPPRCAAQSEASLLARERSAPLFHEDDLPLVALQLPIAQGAGSSANAREDYRTDSPRACALG